ncbi:rhodanese-like domain-containing protein [Undibacterium sp. TJN25]|uniref:rhodanese-like domain-containing protein n=1 Tax=Undibacterium sp. TJN25 TaxID=3413056 RepID=UPI003BF35A77
MEHLSPTQAAEYLQAHPSSLLIDCRSEIEFLFVGHPTGAIHVAWNDGADWAINPRFVPDVKKIVGNGDRAILLICRSGSRSVTAGEALEAEGFKNVINVLHGFEGDLDAGHQRSTINGWRFDGLPWGQC